MRRLPLLAPVRLSDVLVYRCLGSMAMLCYGSSLCRSGHHHHKLWDERLDGAITFLHNRSVLHVLFICTQNDGLLRSPI
jgi:hypothetical protein